MKSRNMVSDELAGLSVRLTDGSVVYFVESEDDEEGETDAGVREPRRPKPGPPPGRMTKAVPSRNEATTQV